jgi:hypothetical protein
VKLSTSELCEPSASAVLGEDPAQRGGECLRLALHPELAPEEAGVVYIDAADLQVCVDGGRVRGREADAGLDAGRYTLVRGVERDRRGGRGGATSIQRPPNCSTGASRRFSKPSFST